MLYDVFIHDELEKERNQNDWKPERQQMPLHAPMREKPEELAGEDDNDEESSNRGVVIIDMNSGEEVEE